MSDTGQVVFLCFMNNECSRGADMNMHLAVVMVLGKISTLFLAGNEIQSIKPLNIVYGAAQSLDFGGKIAFTLFMHKKIKLDRRFIDVSIYIHDQSFGAATIHSPDNMKNPARFMRFSVNAIDLQLNPLYCQHALWRGRIIQPKASIRFLVRPTGLIAASKCTYICCPLFSSIIPSCWRC